MSDSEQEASVSAEESEYGAPATGKVLPDKFSSDEVFQRIVADAEHEVTSNTRELFFSALAAGFAITITYLLYASMSAKADSSIIAALLYPLGFIYIIIGGYQLYTENTLPPVALTLERLSSVPALFRHWLVVLAGNFAGGALGALALAHGGVFDESTKAVAIEIAEKGMKTPVWDLFFKAAFAGLIVAGVVWMIFAASDTISRLAIVYLAFLAIPLGNLFHVVVSFTEVVYLVLVTDLAVGAGMTQFVLPVLVGNTLGGVLLVTVVNYYQTSEQRLEIARFENVRRLTTRELLLGNLAGRSYVPLVDTLEEIARDPDSYRILVPIANPRTEQRLVEFAAKMAGTREKGCVHVVHVVQAPKDISVSADSRQHDRIVRESERLLEDFDRLGERHDVRVDTSTIVSPRSFVEIFDRARRTNPDLVVMDWDREKVWNSARAEGYLDELTNRLPCDFLVTRDRGLDASRILIPTAGGPDSDLSAQTAAILQQTDGAEVTLLHVVDGHGKREAGEQFLREWASDHELDDATLVVDDGGDIEEAIVSEADDATMVLIGATERGLLSRLVTDSLHLDIVDDVDSSVLLAERPSNRGLRERLFGRGRRRK
ncbi:Formate/nitrite transporter FocA, FNT family [Halovenus aranensis]|jgi:formate/nitrite transporter FocA (FNT family)/nucleotide-binding universal stress UspA family protein|uniref:Formate/nitrite transporter FocA, FNT family n=1 Tax=Halovenus aranensis TaxID=890420 RepID=A0A1G8V8U5_9EURY|nr:formate/nitrite transporter family protein [Halovenus aranensis]SDJ61580.1 Formate/nitrite transporter FocA, FNT family [Halovenus aranensis]